MSVKWEASAWHISSKLARLHRRLIICGHEVGYKKNTWLYAHPSTVVYLSCTAFTCYSNAFDDSVEWY
jgi:hypothetical protein